MRDMETDRYHKERLAHRQTIYKNIIFGQSREQKQNCKIQSVSDDRKTDDRSKESIEGHTEQAFE